MEKKAVIIFHQGWTDIILCIGIVFHNLKYYGNLVLLIRDDSKELIDFIFRQTKKLFIDYQNKNNLDNRDYLSSLLKQKYENFDYLPYGSCFNNGFSNKFIPCGSADYFYTAGNIDKDESYKSFLIQRDEELENKKYAKFIEETGKDYIIINEDSPRGINIDKKYLNENTRIYNINGSSNIVFDIIKIIENAKEIHLTSTFWSLIIYNLQKKYNLFSNIPIYFHSYARKGYYDFLYKDINWTFIY